MSVNNLFKKVDKKTTEKTKKPSFKKASKQEEKPAKKFNSLSDIMDWSQPFKMIYSGVESPLYYKTTYDMGIRNFLMSYHYLKQGKVNLNTLHEQGVKIFIDSGAYTYMTNDEYNDYTEEQWESQVKSYVNWCRKHKDIIFAIADLDLQYLVGLDTVKLWRKKYFEPFMLETGIPVCFVWHEVDGMKEWENMCQRYPYVGLSWASDDAGDETLSFKMLAVAEKHNALVHGFGLTRTAILPKLPFYTVDSTTWLAGVRFGELNYWNGSKMSRLKKDKWDSYKNQLLKLGVNWKLLKEEDLAELVRANVYAFLQAEEYIQSRLTSKMYWLRSKRAVYSDARDSSIFPTPDEIIELDAEAVLAHCEKLNIVRLDDDDETTLDRLLDCTLILNWDNEEYDEAKDSVVEDEEAYLDSVHDTYINVICEPDERLEHLVSFFTDVVEGRNTCLLKQLVRGAQERTSYIEEDAYELQDLPESVVRQRLSALLPSPKDADIAPEIDDLDEEIYRQVDIVPVRDENGKFLKGQQKVRKPKNIYSDKFPKLSCDSCINQMSCPEKKAGMVCAYHKIFKKFDTRNPDDISDAMVGMVNMNLERMQRVALQEVLNGGEATGTLTSLIDQNMRLLNTMKQMQESGQFEVLRKTTVMSSDGSTSETTQITNPKSGGILEKLFMSSNSKSREEEDREFVELDS